MSIYNSNVSVTVRKPVSQLDLRYLDLKFLTLQADTHSHNALRSKYQQPSNDSIENSIAMNSKDQNWKAGGKHSINNSIETADITCMVSQRQNGEKGSQNTTMAVNDILDYVATGVQQLYHRCEQTQFSRKKQNEKNKKNPHQAVKDPKKDLTDKSIYQYESKIRKLQKQTALIHEQISKLYYLHDEGDTITQVSPENNAAFSNHDTTKIRAVRNIKIQNNHQSAKDPFDQACLNKNTNRKGFKPNLKAKEKTIRKLGKDYIDEKIVKMKESNQRNITSHDSNLYSSDSLNKINAKSEAQSMHVLHPANSHKNHNHSKQNSRENSYLPSLTDLGNSKMKGTSIDVVDYIKNDEKVKKKKRQNLLSPSLGNQKKYSQSVEKSLNSTTAPKVFLLGLHLHKKKQNYEYFYQKLYQKAPQEQRNSSSQIVAKNLLGNENLLMDIFHNKNERKDKKTNFNQSRDSVNEDYENEQEETLQILKKKMINNNFDKSFESFLVERKMRVPELLKNMR